MEFEDLFYLVIIIFLSLLFIYKIRQCYHRKGFSITNDYLEVPDCNSSHSSDIDL